MADNVKHYNLHTVTNETNTHNTRLLNEINKNEINGLLDYVVLSKQAPALLEAIQNDMLSSSGYSTEDRNLIADGSAWDPTASMEQSDLIEKLNYFTKRGHNVSTSKLGNVTIYRLTPHGEFSEPIDISSVVSSFPKNSKRLNFEPNKSAVATMLVALFSGVAVNSIFSGNQILANTLSASAPNTSSSSSSSQFLSPYSDSLKTTSSTSDSLNLEQKADSLNASLTAIVNSSDSTLMDYLINTNLLYHSSNNRVAIPESLRSQKNFVTKIDGLEYLRTSIDLLRNGPMKISDKQAWKETVWDGYANLLFGPLVQNRELKKKYESEMRSLIQLNTSIPAEEIMHEWDRDSFGQFYFTGKVTKDIKRFIVTRTHKDGKKYNHIRINEHDEVLIPKKEFLQSIRTEILKSISSSDLPDFDENSWVFDYFKYVKGENPIISRNIIQQVVDTFKVKGDSIKVSVPDSTYSRLFFGGGVEKGFNTLGDYLSTKVLAQWNVGENILLGAGAKYKLTDNGKRFNYNPISQGDDKFRIEGYNADSLHSDIGIALFFQTLYTAPVTPAGENSEFAIGPELGVGLEKFAQTFNHKEDWLDLRNPPEFSSYGNPVVDEINEKTVFYGIVGLQGQIGIGRVTLGANADYNVYFKKAPLDVVKNYISAGVNIMYAFDKSGKREIKELPNGLSAEATK